MSDSRFLKILFSLLTAFFLIAAVCMPDRSTMFSGLLQIMTQPSKVSTNYFAVGGYAATFLNTALVSLACLGIFSLPQSQPNQKTVLAYLLVLGFTTWGINLLNIIPSCLGVVIYCRIKKVAIGTQANAMFFSTGAAPLITDLFIRYPYQEVVGFTWYGVLAGTVVGILIGMSMPAGIAHSGKVHKDYDLYSAALPLGLLSFMLMAILYNAPGLKIPAMPDPATLQVASKVNMNILFGTLFLLSIAAGTLLYPGCWKEYGRMLREDNYQKDYLKEYGQGALLLNLGLLGLTILAYYDIIGATMNGVTVGCILCVVSCCGCGSNPKTVIPIMLGYGIGSLTLGAASAALGGEFKNVVYAQPIAVGLCFATGMSPITGRYGAVAGYCAAFLHMCMVTMLPSLHGGFCLYNGGFTAALVCLIVVPQLERYCHTITERREMRGKVSQ